MVLVVMGRRHGAGGDALRRRRHGADGDALGFLGKCLSSERSSLGKRLSSERSSLGKRLSSEREKVLRVGWCMLHVYLVCVRVLPVCVRRHAASAAGYHGGAASFSLRWHRAACATLATR